MSMLRNIRDIAGAVEQDARLQAYRVTALSDEALELDGQGTPILLVTAPLWREEGRLTRLLQRSSGLRPLLLFVASAEDLDTLERPPELAHQGWITLPTTGGALAVTLKSEQAALQREQQAEQRGQQAERYRFELGELISIAAAINSERDINRLLGLILEKSRYVTGADAGSIYVILPHPERSGERLLRFEVAQNDSFEIDFKAFTVEVSTGSIVGAAVIRREVINIPDLYALEPDNKWGFTHDRSFDEHTGYQTRSVLTVPLINQRDAVIGVLQLINKKRAPGLRLQGPEDFRQVIPFDQRAVELCQTLAYQAAISLENALLYEELRRVFEGFVEASMLAIESRDPTTSGHSRRVADLTVGLAEAVSRTGQGQLAEVTFSKKQIKEIEYAGLLHDFGKIGVPEAVLLKSTKLYEFELAQILTRFDYIRLAQRLEAAKKKQELLRQGQSPTRLQAIEAIEATVQEKEVFLDSCLQAVLKANQPTLLDQESSAFLEEVGRQTYLDPQGQTKPYLTEQELSCLKIKRGSLSAQEKAQIEGHVTHTSRFLQMIPWGRSLSQVADIAADHHEKLDGSGYPGRKKEEKISLAARMMAIADIFDALTASDRPYKRAVPWERALDILRSEVEANKLDRALFQLFVEDEVYRRALQGR